MFRPRRSPRVRGFSINQLIPNLLTLCALCAGLTAIRFGLHQRWEMAVGSILLAAVFDGLDGRVARLLHSTSKFGAELDSLSDFVSFGVAPAMLLYLWTMQSAGGPGWALVVLFAICSGLRLARFNTMLGQPDLPAYAYNFFTGVPAPAAAGIVLMPMMGSFQSDWEFFARPWFVGVILVLVSLLMVSKIPTFSGKKMRIPAAYVLPMMLLVGVFGAFLVSAPWSTLSAIASLYVLSIPLSVQRFRQLRRRAEELRQTSHPDITPGAKDNTESMQGLPCAEQ